MGALAEFLKEQKVRIQESGPERERYRSEWLQALDSLYSQIETWVHGVEGHELLEVTRSRLVLTEMRLGRYDVHRLRIELDGSFVEFIPLERFPGGSIRPEGASEGMPISGVVNISQSGDPYQHLYRVGMAGESRWYVSAGLRGDEIRYEPLTQERFERLLVRGLR